MVMSSNHNERLEAVSEQMRKVQAEMDALGRLVEEMAISAIPVSPDATTTTGPSPPPPPAHPTVGTEHQRNTTTGIPSVVPNLPAQEDLQRFRRQLSQRINDDGYRFGDRVRITRDQIRVFRGGRPRLVDTELLGLKGAVVGTTPKFVYIYADSNDTRPFRKGNQNVTAI
jgi:hypothetical protein